MSSRKSLQPATSSERGVKLLHDPVRNKGAAFTERERDALGLRGLLPPRVFTQAEQVAHVLENLRRLDDDLDRYVMLVALQDRNETLFYRVLVDHLEELMPIVYTPTVGRACQEFGHVFRRPRGLYVSIEDRGRVADVVANWPHDEARVVVVTDGGRILGLGDLGAYGMGIPIGKLALYTACAGIHPTRCLPVMLDVGTDNERLHADPHYTGLARRRPSADEHAAIVDELVTALEARFPGVMIQFEDFATRDAFALIERYRERSCSFDDDVQGTGAVALGGLLAAMRVRGERLADQRLLFVGAGEAGVGIADAVVAAMVEEGASLDEARGRCWFVDSRGLVVAGREDLAEHKRRFAHDHAPLDELTEIVEALRPTALIGASGVGGRFDRPVLEAMAAHDERPIVFALSNPTSKSECTARQALEWTGGRAIFASGSPFEPVELDGRTVVPGQCNNAQVFPGIGLGVVASGARRVTDSMFLAAARTLAAETSDDDLALGRLFPAFSRVREVSARIAVAVAEVAWREGLARVERPDDPAALVRSHVFEPVYVEHA